MSALLRFARSVEDDPAIEAWFAQRPGQLGSLARQWFARMRTCGSDVGELFHDGCPVVCVDDAPFAYVNAFKAHVNVGFFHGADLPDPYGLLLGSGKHMRHVKLAADRLVDTAAVDALIHAAYLDIRARLNADRLM